MRLITHPKAPLGLASNNTRPTVRPSLRDSTVALLLSCCAQATMGVALGDAEHSVESYLDLPLQDLLSMEVTTASKKEQAIADTAAAVYVITNEDIKRSGASSVPELLRVVPGFQVARLDANTWAISSRGSNGVFANKLLVLIDGRSVYTPSFSGVYWDIQDTVLEDIERIEVIRGPGATLWGSNAVNGIVNIITKSAADTHGGLAIVSAGNEDNSTVALRYGGPLNARTDGRMYIKYKARDDAADWATGAGARDDWRATRGGFRLDGKIDAQHQWTLQGDVYRQHHAQRVALWQTAPPYRINQDDSATSSGWNLLARWEGDFATAGLASLQVFFDHTNRDEIFLEGSYDTLDIDFQHRFPVTENAEFIWGLGHRHIEDDFENSFNIAVVPSSNSQEQWSAFVQSEISLIPDRVQLQIGSKFENNEITGFDYQPSVRLVWTPDDRHSVWGALSRAVRTPSRVETDGRITTAVAPVPFPPGYAAIAIQGSTQLEPENLVAYELGYRVTNGDNLSLDAAAFFNRYDNLLTNERTSPTALGFDNHAQADSYGLELAVDWRIEDWWRLQATYSWFRLDFALDASSTDTSSSQKSEGANPEHQWSLRSSMNLANDWMFDLWVHHVDRLPVASVGAQFLNVQIPAYTSVNARVAWQVNDDLELSLVGHNLFDSKHLEFIDETLTPPAEIEKSIYAQLRLSF